VAVRQPPTARPEPPTDPSTVQTGLDNAPNGHSDIPEPAPFDIEDLPTTGLAGGHPTGAGAEADSAPQPSRVTVEDVDKEYKGNQPGKTAEERVLEILTRATWRGKTRCDGIMLTSAMDVTVSLSTDGYAPSQPCTKTA
jgi:hypothetical protein